VDELVRPLTASDIKAVEQLQAEARAALEPVRGGAALLAEQPPTDWAEAVGRAWVALLDDVVLGYLELRIHEHTAIVQQVYVHPEARELGLGDGLLAAATHHAKIAGCTVLEGTALPGDRETKNLYERAGVVARKIVLSKRL
jgi:GNAT superfamily N-acetyltransferase